MGAYKDEKRGTWMCKFKYRDWQGKIKWLTKRGFKTKRETLNYEREFIMKKAGDLEMTMGAFVEVYKKEVYPRIKYSTTLTKTNIINKHIVSYFGEKKLTDITKKDIIAWQNELITFIDPRTGKGFTKSYLKTIHNQLSAILNYAVKYYDLKENVAAKVGNMGSEADVRVDFWTKEEYLKFREVMMDYPLYYYCFEILYWCGIREGELLALTQDDIDFHNNEIRITKTYHHLEGKDIITSPKTKTSYRNVVMPEFLAEELKDYIKMIYKLKPTDRLFPTNKSCLSKMMKKGALESDIKKIRVHDLRHSHVSLLINLGYNVTEIANRVGHESVEVTYKYGHMFPDAQSNIASKLNKLVGGK